MTYRSQMIPLLFIVFKLALIWLLRIILFLPRIPMFFPFCSILRRNLTIIIDEIARYLFTCVNSFPDKRKIHRVTRLTKVVEMPLLYTTIQHAKLFIKALHPPRLPIAKRPIQSFKHYFFIIKLHFRDRIAIVHLSHPTSKLILRKYLRNRVHIKEKTIPIPQLMFYSHQAAQTTKYRKKTTITIEILLYLLVKLTLVIRPTVETCSYVTIIVFSICFRT